MMRVVVDGTPLCSQLTGIGQYTHSLLSAMADVRPHWEFVVLSPYSPLEFVVRPNVHHDLSAARSRDRHARGWRAGWFDALLPGMVKNLSPAAFWATDGQAPFRLKDVPVALTVYDFVARRYPQTMSFGPRHYRRNNQSFWLARARWRLPISRSVADEMHAITGLRATAVVHPGVDSRFRLTSSDEVEPYVVVLGTLEPRKNLDVLMRVLQTLNDDGAWPEGLKVRLVGAKGWRDGPTSRAIDALEATGLVSRTGYLPRSAIPTLLSRSRALLMPSLYEGFGMPVAEAIAAGCPVVCSDIPPFREITQEPYAMFHGTSEGSILATYRALLRDDMGQLQRPRPGLADQFDWAISAQAFATALESNVSAIN